MKRTLLNKKNAEGNTLILTVVITALIGLVLAAYLSMISHQSATNFRSQAWNSVIPVIEAGLEHALSHLNANVNMDTGIGLELARDGWTTSGSTFVTTNSLADGRYRLVISQYTVGARTNAPVVESFGYVNTPLMAVAPTPGPFLAVIGVANSTAPQASMLRAVRIRCRMDAMYSKGLLTKDIIDLNGNDIMANSFDSTDPNFSNNGRYDPSRFKANGDIASNASITNSLRIGNATIYGHVATGPEGSFSIGSNGQVGDTNFVAVGTNRVQTGYYKDDMNVEFIPITVPFAPNECVAPDQRVWVTNATVQTMTNSYSTLSYPLGVTSPIMTNLMTANQYPLGSSGPVSTNVDKGGRITGYTYPVFSYSTTTQATNNVGVLYDYALLRNDNYILRDVAGKIYVSAQANLYVDNRINMMGQDVIEIAPGASLNLYMAGADAAIGGNGVINRTGFATNFCYYGLPSNTQVSIAGNGGIIGVINAPDAELVFQGGGTTADMDFTGAAIARSAVMGGHFNFHYDESLAKWGPIRGYIVSSWYEMSPTDIQARLGTGSSSPSGTETPIYVQPPYTQTFYR